MEGYDVYSFLYGGSEKKNSVCVCVCKQRDNEKYIKGMLTMVRDVHMFFVVVINLSIKFEIFPNKVYSKGDENSDKE